MFEIDERRVEILPRIAVLEAIPKDASTAAQKQELEALKGEEKALETEEKALKKLIE